MKELNKATLISVLIHGAMLGVFVWLTESSDLSTDVMGGEDAPAGEISLASNSPANRPIDVSDLQVPPQPTPPQDEVKPEMPPEIPDPPKPVEPEQPTPAATDEPAVKETPNAVPIIEKKDPAKVKPKIKKTVVKPSPPAVAQPKSAAQRIAEMRASLDKSHARKSNTRLFAMAGAAAGSGTPGTNAKTIGDKLGRGVRNETLGTISVGGGGRGGAGVGGSGGGNSGADGSPDGDRYGGALMAYLKRAWQQPSRAEVGGGNPTVVISLTIQSDGTVTGARITRGSQTNAMDASLNALIRNLQHVPAPSSYGKTASSVTVSVKFKLD